MLSIGGMAEGPATFSYLLDDDERRAKLIQNIIKVPLNVYITKISNIRFDSNIIQVVPGRALSYFPISAIDPRERVLLFV